MDITSLEDVSVSRWEWNGSDTGRVFLAGYNDDGEKVATRVFDLVGTHAKDSDGEWVSVDDDGGWSK